jgi:hypothetical protein
MLITATIFLPTAELKVHLYLRLNCNAIVDSLYLILRINYMALGVSHVRAHFGYSSV